MRNQIYSPAVLANYSVIMPGNEERVLKGEFFERYSKYLNLLRTTEPKDKRAVNKALKETIYQLEMFHELAIRAKLHAYDENSKVNKTVDIIQKEINFLEWVYRALRKHLEKARYV